MKVWYHPKHEMYVPSNPYWNDEWDEELIEVEITKEEIIVGGGSNDPYNHSGRWESTWSEERFEHSIMNKIPWKPGKYKITIESIEEEES